MATPAIGDVNGDGKPEIVVSSWQGTVYVVGPDGQAAPGLAEAPAARPVVPARHPERDCAATARAWTRVTTGRAARAASPVLADFDHDGKPEIVQAAFDGNVYVWHGDGTPLARLARAAPRQAGERVQPHPVDARRGRLQRRRHPRHRLRLERGGRRGRRRGHGASSSTAAGMNTPAAAPTSTTGRVVLTSLHIFPVVGEGTRQRAGASPTSTGTGHPQALLTGNGAQPYIFPADPGLQTGFDDPPNRGPCYDEDRRRRAGPVRHAGRAGRLRSDGHLRRRLAGEASRHDVPALQQPLGRRPRSGRRARHHHVGRQPEPHRQHHRRRRRA